MTVAGLWKSLEDAGCGIPIGVSNLIVESNINDNNDVITRNGMQQVRRPVKTLAVDLSIWICEAMTCTATRTFHLNPALYVVYQRTLKLLKMGLKLVFVIEGVRRRQKCDEYITNSKSNNASFWRICENVEKMLGQLGVPVLRAKKEGEALCALLNQRGLVDGVISNDADCFLFGATIVFTNFTLENLNQNNVIRFDDTDLRAVAPREDDDKYESSQSGCSSSGKFFISLSRSNLVAFALLSGSDVVGEGLPNIGPKKAIRFINMCKQNNALDEIRSWSKKQQHNMHTTFSEEQGTKKASRCCTNCLHPGDFRYHKKHGCSLCGTEKGQGCKTVSNDGKFVIHLQSEAMEVTQHFDPERVISTYFQTMDEVPCSLFECKQIDLKSILQSQSMIIKGKTIESSKEYILSTLPKLICRLEMLRNYKYQFFSLSQYDNKNAHYYYPVPVRIIKKAIHEGRQCYEVEWSMSSNNNNNMVEYNKEIYLKKIETYEWQGLFDNLFPFLINKLRDDETKHDRIKLFTGTITNNIRSSSRSTAPRRGNKEQVVVKSRPSKRKKNERHFDQKSNSIAYSKPDYHNHNNEHHLHKSRQVNTDVTFLISNNTAVPDRPFNTPCNKESYHKTPYEENFTITTTTTTDNDDDYDYEDCGNIKKIDKNKKVNQRRSYSHQLGLPSSRDNNNNTSIIFDMGLRQIKVSPISSRSIQKKKNLISCNVFK